MQTVTPVAIYREQRCSMCDKHLYSWIFAQEKWKTIHNKTYTRMFIESSLIHNIHNMERIQVSNDRKMHKQTVLNSLTLVNKKEQTTGWI